MYKCVRPRIKCEICIVCSDAHVVGSAEWRDGVLFMAFFSTATGFLFLLRTHMHTRAQTHLSLDPFIVHKPSGHTKHCSLLFGNNAQVCLVVCTDEHYCSQFIHVHTYRTVCMCALVCTAMAALLE